MTPSTATLLTEWNWEPSVVIGLLLFTCAYFYASGPLRRRYNLGPPLTRKQVVVFVLAQVILAVGLLSPIDYIGDSYLFSVHMVQHLLLATIWPPLMLVATPPWMAQRILRWPVVGPLISFCTQPFMAITLFSADIYMWHLPVLYDLTLSNEEVHIVEHLSFMAFGLANWWPILSPIRSRRLIYPLQVLYLFADGMLMMIPGIVFTFATIVFYPPYAAAPRLWGIDALTDQQFGGLIMWYPGNIPYAISLVVAFYRWFEGGGSAPVEARMDAIRSEAGQSSS